MHVPDGYLSPATCGVLYATATPFWAVAVARVRHVVGSRTVPLLAIFSAFAFAIMMFNVPVPGGTTAHAVGGTFAAIVIGPWAAVISTSVAIIIQALFFGDGGITAIGANAFNMGILLPLAGYLVYRLASGRSSVLSQRRVVAAAIGSYVGITLAALAVGFELGIQPDLYSTHGIPDYSPYGLSTAIPAMLLAHVFGASFVEAAITALGLAYLQRSYPEILLRRENNAEGAEEASGWNPWAVAGVILVVAAIVVFAVGWIKGGSLQHWGGLHWATVTWSAVLKTVALSAAMSAVVLPLSFLALRSRRVLRGPAMIFAAIVIWAPIGLIAPGGAFGEDTSATQAEVTAALQARASGDASLFNALPSVNRECACVPAKLNDVTVSGSTLFSGYKPPWVSSSDPAWKQDLGYQVADVVGLAILVGVLYTVYLAGRWLMPSAPPDWRTAE